jgi:hypothetical protein
MKLLNIYNSLITEVIETAHLFDRLKERLGNLSEIEISSMDRTHLERYIEIISKMNFSPRHSFAIKLMDLYIDPQSSLYVKVGGREYYTMDDFLGRDSTGNEIWCVIRNNRIITIMLRKSIQPIAKLRTDYVVNSVGELQELISNNLAR